MRPLCIRLLSALLAVATAASAQVPGESLRIDDRIVVRVLGGTPAPATLTAFIDGFETLHAGTALAAVDEIPGRGIYLLSLDVPPGTDLDAIETSLELDFGATLEWAEMLYDNDVPEGGTGSTWVDGAVTALLYRDQYATGLVGVDAAHGVATGAGVVVAVLDTGVDTGHVDLAAHVLLDGYDFIDDDAVPADVGDGLDTDGDGTTDEMVGHGTFVAGLVALVAPEARILPVRVLDADGHGDAWVLARGLFHAIDRGVEVINMSLRSTYDSAAVEAAVGEARSHGIVLAAAAGNFDRDTPREYPASQMGVIAVAATDDNDIKASFSNFGDRIFMTAPGATLLASPGDADPLRSVVSTMPGDAYAAWEGTSMATPLVSGAAALIRSQHPEWSATEFVAVTIETRLATGAADVDTANPLHAGLLGVGRLDAAASVQLGPAQPTTGDFNHDGLVGVSDLLRVLADWGLVHSSADLTSDGVVDVFDILEILNRWS